MTDKATPLFGQAYPIFAIRPGATASDIRECVDARLSHLSAALLAISGDGHDAFSRMNAGARDDYVGMALSLVFEIQDLLSAMRREVRHA